MANEEHLAILEQGVDKWHQWREGNLDIRPDLSWARLIGAHLSGARLDEADLSGANLTRVRLKGAHLKGADLTGANLRGAHLNGADLRGTHLSGASLNWTILDGANLDGADLHGASLFWAWLRKANLMRARLDGAVLIRTNCEGANLTGCRVYGITVWDVNLREAKQKDLIITPRGEPEITVDNVEVAQFIYLLLHNEKVSEVIETVTSKAVLILGRFTPERKAVLDALREALRTRDRLPIVFDFARPGSQTTLETVSTLAHMARFVIADLTDAKSVLQELQAIVPSSPSVLIQPILLASQEEPGMFDFFRRFPWVLEPYRYHSQEEVLAVLDAKILAPVEARYGR
jgi:hypothetical protein